MNRYLIFHAITRSAPPMPFCIIFHIFPNPSYNQHTLVSPQKHSFMPDVCENDCMLQSLPYTRPQLEYASTVWTPHTQWNINQLEMVQRRAAWYVYRDFSPYSSKTTMFQQLDQETLEMRRQIMMYRIKNQLIDIPASLYAPPPQRVPRDHPHQIMIERTRLNVYAQSYFPAVQRPWNALHASYACAPTLDAFKQQSRRTLFDFNMYCKYIPLHKWF